MQRKMVQRIVTTASLAVAVVGIGLFLYFRLEHMSVPLWVDVAMSYGLIFALFLFLDTFSKAAARARGEADASSTRPRPVTAPQPEQRPAVPVQLNTQADHVRLVRIAKESESQLVSLLNRAVPEVLALDEQQPPEDSSGQAGTGPARAWLQAENVYPFFITYQENTVGCCILAVENNVPTLEFLYIEPGQRRHRFATYALRRLIEFIDLLGADEGVFAVVSSSNGRGQRFLTANGFAKVPVGAQDEGLKTNRESMDRARFPYQPLPLKQEFWRSFR